MINDYALLTRLPLLQGISSTELLSWEEALRLDIDELPVSKLPLIHQGETCTQLLWLVEGELIREHHSENGVYAIRSTLKAPAAIETDRLFGLYTTYEYTYWAHSDVRMLSIGKNLTNQYLMKSEVFRINLLNTLSAISQKKTMALIPSQLGNTEERLKHFLCTLLTGHEGKVEVFIQMKDLAHYIGRSRLNTSRLLNQWHAEGIITLGRENFIIHDIQTLRN